MVCGCSGMITSVIAVIGLIFLCRPILTKEDVGVILRQKSGSLFPEIIIVLALTTWATYVGIHSPRGELDYNALLTLAVIPGLSEELVYRGYLMAILNKITPSRFMLFGAPIGWGALITLLLFGLLHGIWFDGNLCLQFNWIALRNATISGFVYAWLRERTGSLCAPIIVHSLEDVFFFLPRMICL